MACTANTITTKIANEFIWQTFMISITLKESILRRISNIKNPPVFVPDLICDLKSCKNSVNLTLNVHISQYIDVLDGIRIGIDSLFQKLSYDSHTSNSAKKRESYFYFTKHWRNWNFVPRPTGRVLAWPDSSARRVFSRVIWYSNPAFLSRH